MCPNEVVFKKDERKRKKGMSSQQLIKDSQSGEERCCCVTRLVGDLQSFFHQPINTEEIQMPGHSV